MVTPAIEGVAEMGIPVTPQVRCLGINDAAQSFLCVAKSMIVKTTTKTTMIIPTIFNTPHMAGDYIRGI